MIILNRAREISNAWPLAIAIAGIALVAFLAIGLPSVCYAQESLQGATANQESSSNVIDSGTWGTCPWEYTDDQTLTIYPGSNWLGLKEAQADINDYRTIYKTNLMELSNIKRIVFKEVDGQKVIAPRSCSHLCSGLGQLESIDFSGLDTSGVEDMSYMFTADKYYRTTAYYNPDQTCPITEVDLSHLDLANVTNTSRMFENCHSLAKVDFSGVKLSHVQNMSGMFNATAIKQIDLADSDCSMATDISEMFKSCEGLEFASLPAFSSNTAINANMLFWNCVKLKKLDISAWNKQKISNAGYMFCGCSSLINFDATRIDASSVGNMECMFSGCSSLKSLDTAGWHTTGCSYYSGMFSGCSSLKSLDLSHFSTSATRNGLGQYNSPDVSGCDSLERITLGSAVEHITGMSSANSINGHSDWFSHEARRWIGGTEFISNRLGIADTYTKYVPVNLLSYYLVKEVAYTGAPQNKTSIYAFLKGQFTMARVMPWGSILYTDDEAQLKEGTDYTVSYSNCKAVGTATATITGKGNTYIGKTSLQYKIVKASNKATVKKTKVSKTIKARTLKKAKYLSLPKVTTLFGKAKWKPVKADKKKVLSLSGNKVKVKRKTKKGIYTVKLQAYVKGTKNYSAAKSRTVTVKVAVK